MGDSPIAELKVVDCATVIAAPVAAMILGDFGADVIKVELPGDGDMLRLLSHIPTTPNSGSDWFWHMSGRNKRGLALNLQDANGVQVLQRLVAWCDVFITNHPYSVREKLGLTYAELKPLNPSMIYASLTAYGEEGEERDRRGFDQLAYWARSGLMDLMREPGTRPTQGLPGMGDHPTGVALYAAIVTALLKRERTGEGAFVHTSLLANGLWSCAGIAGGVLAGGDMAKFRDDNAMPSPMMRPYRTRDDRWLQFNMVRNEELLSLLLTAMEVPELMVDPRFADAELMWQHREEFSDALQAQIESQDAADWMQRFGDFDLPVNLVARVEEVVADTQAFANGIARSTEPLEVGVPASLTHPLNVSSVPSVAPTRGPDLGEHAQEILRELGYSEAEIAKMGAALS